MTPLVAAIYLVPPALAVALSFRAKSKAGRTLLLAAGVASLVVFAVLALAYLDCEFNDFTYMNCGFLPAIIARALGLLQALFLVAYLVGGPVLLVIAAILEMIARTRL